ncbi:MAG: hypothetical protein IJK08_06525, partial [Prevotella sp.]|nr:hypothetical protein [Prevotella sp.]
SPLLSGGAGGGTYAKVFFIWKLQTKKKPSTIIIVEGDRSENSFVCYFTSGKKRVIFLRTAE